MWVVAVGNDQEERTWHSGVGLGTTAGEGTEATARTLAPGNPETHKLSFGIDSSLKTHSSVVKRKGIENREQTKGKKEHKIEKRDRPDHEGKEGSPRQPWNSTHTIPLAMSHWWVSLPESQQLIIKG